MTVIPSLAICYTNFNICRMNVQFIANIFSARQSVAGSSIIPLDDFLALTMSTCGAITQI